MYTKYEELIYEYLYISNKIKIFESNNFNNIIRKECLKAIKKLINIININSTKDIENYLNLHNKEKYNKQSEKLYKKCLKEIDRKNFFDEISKTELYIYHILNYDISYEYGVNLSKHINFNEKSILDIGGSTGGLCKGILDKNKNVKAYVFDTKESFKITKEHFNNTNINYIQGNFLKNVNLKGKYDYIIFSNIIHDWNDYNTIKILNNFKNIIKNSKYIIIHEDIIFNNIETLIYGLRLSANVFEGRQRTKEEIFKILKKCFFKENIKLEKILRFNILSALLFKIN